MKNKKIFYIALFMLTGALYTNLNAQNLTLSPSKDAYLLLSLRPGSEYMANTNYGNIMFYYGEEWTAGGYRVNARSVMDFDFAVIPSDGYISEARLSLYSMQPQPNDNYRHMNYITMQNTGYRSNACYLERITEDWNEQEVTYNTQPASITTNRAILPISQTFTENYIDVDVTALVKDMHANRETSFGFMLRLVSETRYTRMALCSRNHPDSARHPKLTIKYLDRLSAGSDYNLILKNDGTLWAWGENSHGQLGDGTTVHKNIPIQVGSDSDWKQVSAGHTHAVAIKNDGTLWCWGTQGGGTLGDPTQRLIPEMIDSSKNWSKVSAGFAHILAIKTDGTLWAWGDNRYGELGDGTMFNRYLPVKIGYAKDWNEIEAGFLNSFAIKTDGTLWAWGDNRYGQLGDGTTTRKYAPVKIAGDNSWKKVAVGNYHTLAINKNGTLWAWGNNVSGQLGDGTNISSYVPLQVGTSDIWYGISAGSEFSQAVASDGTIWGWGNNAAGQLGDGTGTNHIIPVQVPDVTGCVLVVAGWSHSFILNNHNQYCGTGSNYIGQLGDGTYIDKNIFDCFPSAPETKSTNTGESSTIFDQESESDFSEVSHLQYNTPNPSTGITTIFYYLAEETENAKIVIYSLFDGKSREFPVLNTGNSSIQLNLEDMPAGVYSYSLIINGVKADEKKLVLTK